MKQWNGFLGEAAEVRHVMLANGWMGSAMGQRAADDVGLF